MIHTSHKPTRKAYYIFWTALAATSLIAVWAWHQFDWSAACIPFGVFLIIIAIGMSLED